MQNRDLTGDWIGNYQQTNKKKPIRLELVQEGDSLSGFMFDLETVSEMTLFELIAESGLPPGSDEKIEEKIRAELPNAGDQAVIFKSILPEKATVAGTMGGGFVNFTKQYVGDSIQRYEIGDHALASTIPGHDVQYSGQIMNHQNSIVGRWTIYDKNAACGFIDGAFELHRDESRQGLTN